MQYGARYYLNETTYSQNVILQSRIGGSSQNLTGTTKVFMGGDPFYATCHCYLQHLRVYWDYLADSQDKMINLAMIGTEGISLYTFFMRGHSLFLLSFDKATLYQFYFISDPQTNNNQTFIVNSLTNTGDIEKIGFKGKIFSNECWP